MLSATRKNRSKRAWWGIKDSALAVLLVTSALLIAVAVGSADHSWFTWFALLPLFLAIRQLPPALAALAGAFWGGCFCLFLAVGVTPSLSLSLHSFALSVTALMLYAYCGARVTRWIGFSPMLLALGWVLVEMTLKPLGLRRGLLAGPQSANGFLHWMGYLLGYAFVALLVAGVNAWLVVLLTDARLRPVSPNARAAWSNAERYPPPQTFLHSEFLPLSEVYPRPPPNVYRRAVS